jgi:sulfhydrogenase subunit beta (sulfur reductase)
MLILASDFLSFFEKSREGPDGLFERIIVPHRPEEEGAAGPSWMPLDGRPGVVLDDYRTVDPLKLLFYTPRDQVAPCQDVVGPWLILGAKACDLKALEILDRALINDEFVDAAYKARREAATVVSFDCRRAAPTCHCTLRGGAPYAESGFDVNAAPAGDDLLLSAGSDKGRRFLDFLASRLPTREDTDAARALVAERRASLVRSLEEQNRAYDLPRNGARLTAAEASFWGEESSKCVGCGACTNACPSCYCLILNDATADGPFTKLRGYDSCQWNGYARVAGGATPRPHMSDRFRHRYLCKFIWMEGQFGRSGCTGCGRCTEACPAGIEFRAVVRKGADAAPKAAAPSEARST